MAGMGRSGLKKLKYSINSRRLFRVFLGVLLFLVLMFLLFRYIVGVSLVSGNSMYPAYRDGQPVFYNRLAGSFNTGDVVSLRMPDGDFLIKRIVAVAGDTVDIIDGALYVNGNPEDGDYVNGETSADSESGVEYPLEIGDRQFFILGDNREVSVDSRSFGAVAASQITGKIL